MKNLKVKTASGKNMEIKNVNDRWGFEISVSGKMFSSELNLEKQETPFGILDCISTNSRFYIAVSDDVSKLIKEFKNSCILEKVNNLNANTVVKIVNTVGTYNYYSVSGSGISHEMSEALSEDAQKISESGLVDLNLEPGSTSTYESKEMTLNDFRNLAKRANKILNENEEQEKNKQDIALKEAVKTGKPVMIHQESDLDVHGVVNIITYVYPDGKIKTITNHAE